jgi:hypothetical protein
MYLNLLAELSQEDNRLTPENFEQRTNLNINTYPTLMKIFLNIDHEDPNINKIVGRTQVDRFVNDLIDNSEDSKDVVEQLPLRDLLKSYFGNNSSLGYINHRLDTFTYLRVKKNNYSILNPTGSSGYSMRYNKLDLIQAMIDLGFAPYNDPELTSRNPLIRKATLADIKPAEMVQEKDNIIPLIGFNNNKYFSKDRFSSSGTKLASVGDKTDYLRHGGILDSLIIYYETIYRALARTSQHLPWEDFILKLARYEKLLSRQRSQGIHGFTPTAVYPLNILPDTIKFIARYDYDVSQDLIANSSLVEICKIIQARVLVIQKEYRSALASEIKTEQPQFIGGIVPKSQYLSTRKNIDEYLIHYQDVLTLCTQINELNNDDPEHRSELFRYLELFDLFGLFKKPLDTYNNKQICSTLCRYLRSLFEERRQGGHRMDQYL